ncbi:MAG TPA: glycosyl hydrolase [Phycisphaerae bacterium]|nr:glycosyl hydrolase [Phycisphaerae bacterium]
MSERNEWSSEDWQRPPSIYRGAPFWAWNDRLDTDRLSRQIGQMHGAGMGGFFMHSRYGLKTPYLSGEWFDCIWACVERARSLGMKAYLYDEDRWPSGAAGGLVTRDRPEYARSLLIAARCPLPEELEPLGVFAVRIGDAGGAAHYRLLEDGQEPAEGETPVFFAAGTSEPSAWFNEAAYLDVLNSEAVGEFIRLTHQCYADRYAHQFGSIIPAIFTDEPNYGHGSLSAEGKIATVPWTAALPREFRRRRGYDLRDHLPELFDLGGPRGAAFSKVRHDFWLTLTELFVESFSAQIGRWCQKHNLAFTGHYLAEETLASQIAQVGSAMPHYAHMQWPGIDILTDQRREILTVKQCTSVAAQLGRDRVLSELYGCTGWDWQLEGHKFNGGWQYVLGVNFRCPHLSLYSLAGGAKRDYPASIFPHSPWWKYYPLVEDYFARLGVVLTAGTPVRDVLVIHPIESAFGLYMPGRGDATDEIHKPYDALLLGLLDGHYDYDLGDESILADAAKVAADRLKVGRMTYRTVIVPPTITLRATTAALLKRFAAAGGQVLFAGRTPDRIDGEPSGELAGLVESSPRCDARPEAVVARLESLLDRRVSLTAEGREVPGVWSMLRQVKSGQVLFVQSTDRAAGHQLRVCVRGHRPVVLMDPATGQRRRLEAEVSGDRVAFELELPPTGSALVSLGLRAGDARAPQRPLAVASAIEATPPWPIELLEPNTFPLDTCRFRVGTDEFSRPMPVLLAEEHIRTRFGLPNRKAGGCQPWHLAQTGRADATPRGRCQMEFAFHVSDLPARLRVAIERPANFEITLNGRPIPAQPTGWWVDEDLELIDLTPAVRTGDNELLLTFDYRSDMELEDLHLVGRFGVRQTGPRRTFDAYTLTTPPDRLAAGNWIGQGLDFYTGAVKYAVTVPDGVWPALSAGKRIRLTLPAVRCTCAAVHVGDRVFVLPWPPMAADITDALLTCGRDPCNIVHVEVIGGRKNILGPLHVPWKPWTGPGEFDPHHPEWTDEYLLTDHGLIRPPVFEMLE